MTDEPEHRRGSPEERTLGIADRVWLRAFKIGLPIAAVRIALYWAFRLTESSNAYWYGALCFGLPLFPECGIARWFDKVNRDRADLAVSLAYVATGVLLGLLVALPTSFEDSRPPHRRPPP